MPTFIAKPPTFRPAPPADPAFARGLLGAWVAARGFPSGYRDFSGNGLDATFNGGWTPTQAIGPYGPAWQFDASHYASANVQLTPSIGNTILLVGKPSNNTGTDLGSSGTTNIYYPYQGRVYWDYQGTSSRISWGYPAGWDSNWHAMAFRAGPRSGCSIWADGVQVVTGATYSSPSPIPGETFLIGKGNASAGNAAAGNATFDSVFLFSGELSDAQIRRWSADPWYAFRPRAQRLRYAATTAATAKPWLYRPANHLIGAY